MVKQAKPNWFWVESGMMLIALPLLLFPTVSIIATAVSLILLIAVWLIGWRVLHTPFPRSPFNSTLLLLAIMSFVAIGVTADLEFTYPKAMGLILGFAMFRYLSLVIKAEQQLLLGGVALFGIAIGMVVVGILSANWLFKVEPIATLVALLPTDIIQLPNSPEEGVHANNIAGLITMQLPILLALLLGWRPQTYRKWVQLTLWLIFLFFAGILLLTQSRSGWLGAILGSSLAVYVWLYTKSSSEWQKRIHWGTAVGAILLMLGFVFGGAELIQSVWTEPDIQTPVGSLHTVSFRREVWTWGVRAVGDFPFTGTGLGSFRGVGPRLYPLNLDPSYDFGHVHNIFLQTALDVGLPGLIAYLSMLMVAIGGGWHVIRHNAALRPFAIGILSGFLAIHIYGIMDAQTLGARPHILFWIALGLLNGMMEMTPQPLALSFAQPTENEPTTA